MNKTNKTAVQAAVLIHERLLASQHQDQPISLPDYSWGRIQMLQRQIRLAGRCGWRRAVARLTADLAGELESCCRQLESVRRLPCFRPVEETRVSSATAIHQDLLALDDEFEEVKIDVAGHTLAVTTDCIVLEEIELGRFEIRLDWHGLGSPPAYRVVALDPHPPARRDDVTHPHVQDDTLCEGEGRVAIQAALAQCRLHDFFLLVSQTLHTYGRGSAYVELDNWFGASCTDCGGTMSPDDSYSCNRCGSELCEDCRASCAGCEESHCSECLSRCPGCEADFCGGCLEMCSGCKRSFCAGCLTTCAACGRDFCDSCLKTCPMCDKPSCKCCWAEKDVCPACHNKQATEEKPHDPPQNQSGRPAARPQSRGRRRAACVSA
jgi:hypothetical protein